MLLSGGLVRRAPRFSGETEGRVLVENLKRVVAGREAGGEPTVRQDPEVPGVSSPVERTQKAQEGRVREAGSTAEGDKLWRGEEKPKRVSAQSGFGRRRVRISAGSKTLKLRGIVIFWSSEQQNAMSRTARRELALRGVRLRGGERLCRVNPMSGTGLRGRKALEGGSRQEVEKT
jgi:hypothetical protein